MCKILLSGEQITDVSFIDDAARWARELTRTESRGSGDMENAWRRLEARYGIPPSTFWALRYRRPKDIWASIYLRLRAAYEAECARQMRRLEIEIATTKAKAGSGSSAVASAEALVDEDESEVEREDYPSQLVERDAALSRAIKRIGTSNRLAQVLGVTPQALSQWHRVPPLRVLHVERATGVPRHELRPDLYPPPIIQGD